jgi:hypothetical protein
MQFKALLFDIEEVDRLQQQQQQQEQKKKH